MRFNGGFLYLPLEGWEYMQRVAKTKPQQLPYPLIGEGWYLRFNAKRAYRLFSKREKSKRFWDTERKVYLRRIFPFIYISSLWGRRNGLVITRKTAPMYNPHKLPPIETDGKQWEHKWLTPIHPEYRMNGIDGGENNRNLTK